MIKTLSISLVLFFLLFQTDSQAYIDPGTGGLIIQAILGAIAAVGIFFTNLKQKIKNLLSPKKKKNPNED